jgi:hypothetical protein
MLPIAASQAGASGGTTWQEAIVTISHAVAGPVMIVGFGVLPYELFCGKNGLDILGKNKEAEMSKTLH